MAGCSTERLDLEPGLSVVRSSFLPRREVRETHANPPERGTLVLTVGLEGCSTFDSEQGEHLGFAAGFTTAAAFMGSAGERRFPAGQRVAQLRLLVEEAVIERCLGAGFCRGLMPSRGVRALSSVRTPAASVQHALALFRSTSASGLARLEGQIHALSLMADQLKALGLVERPSAAPGRDSDRLARARDLMQAQMDRPLTVPYLCAAVGMSETRFKAGFREAFGMPPGQMLLRMRMERAKGLLDAGGQVAEAAWQVGYAHAANFSTAYRRYFGHPPRRGTGA